MRSEFDNSIQVEGKAAKQRYFWLDVVRIVAILSITLNHAVNRTYQNYHGQMNEFLNSSRFSMMLKTAVTVFSHLGVPLFLMISGALILSKKMESRKNVRHFYRHNLLSLLITSEIWYAVMYWFIVFVTPGVPMLRDNTVLQLIWGMVKTMLFIDQTTLGSMWYIPVILCLYTVLPLFALLLRKVPLRTFVLPSAIVFVILILHNVNLLLTAVGIEYRISLALNANNVFPFYLIYVLSGWWVKEGGLRCVASLWIVLGTIASFFLTCALQYYMYSRPADCLLDYDFTGYIVCAGFLFELIRRSADRIRGVERPVTVLARTSFAIYFIHIIIMTALVWYSPSISRPWMKLLYLEGISVGGSVILIWLLAYIPCLRKHVLYLK